MNLSRLICVGEGSRLAVSGCGGKTSIINILAREAEEGMSVLISPSTKICPVFEPGVALVTTRDECLAHVPVAGIQYLGLLNPETGKLESLSPDDLEAIAGSYGLALIEADGSRGLPCKGWTDRDPVIPAFATHTLGVLSIKAVGLPATEDNVFRLPEFSALTGMKRGEPVTVAALAAMAGSPGGMFRRRAGEEAIVINQAESPLEIELACDLARQIRAYRGAPRKILAGSAKLNEWAEL